MKLLKHFTAYTIALGIAVGSFGIALAAPAFSDVPATHWAYQSISRIAERGILVGDTSGNYKPDDYIDKFETAKILAKLDGYKQTGYSDSEKTYYDKAYDKNKSLLSQYSKAFSKWNSTADRDIAYLLEKEILTAEDLNQFVILRNDGSEAIRALSREEAATFLVKLMGRKNEALSYNTTSTFKDDSSISVGSKPYVYYLRSINVTSGDSNNEFLPNGAVTRATLAVLLDKALAIMEEGQSTQPVATSSSNASDQVSKIETVSGTFDKLFNSGSTNAIQLVTPDGTKKIYKIANQISIYIDGFLKTSVDLKAGMPMLCVLNNYELIDIKAQSVTSLTTGTPSTSTGTITTEPITNIQLATLEGTIASLSSDLVTKTVGIEIRMLNPRGEIITEIKYYALSDDCKIIRGDMTVPFDGINKGDIVKAEVSGAKAYSLSLEQKNRTIAGTLIEKKYIKDSNIPILVIENSLKIKSELRVTTDTFISRKGSGKVSWNELRIGDAIEATAEYDALLELFATGTRSTVDGVIEDIYIDSKSSSITVRENNLSKKYTLITGTVDVYSLRIGSKVRLRLDSMEVETLSVLQDASTTGTFTGHITNIKRNSIVIRESDGSYNSTREIFFDNDTIIMDSITGNKTSTGFLKEDMKVYAVVKNTSSNVAYTITILSR